MRLIAERGTAGRGETAYLGFMFSLAPGWHTYADPPGDVGMAPILELNLPPGFEAGPLEYPPHEEFKDAAGVSYGYADKVLLRVPVRVAPDAGASGALAITGRLDYLICKDVCVPQRAELSGTLAVGDASSVPSAEWLRALSEGGWENEE